MFWELLAKPQFMDARIYSENICELKSQKTPLWIKKYFYVGFCVLEFAKLHIYRYALNTIFFLNVPQSYLSFYSPSLAGVSSSMFI